MSPLELHSSSLNVFWIYLCWQMKCCTAHTVVLYTGFLEIKLCNLRQNLEQRQRRYRKQKVMNDCSGKDMSDTAEDEHTVSLVQMNGPLWLRGCGPHLRTFQPSGQAWRKHTPIAGPGSPRTPQLLLLKYSMSTHGFWTCQVRFFGSVVFCNCLFFRSHFTLLVKF